MTYFPRVRPALGFARWCGLSLAAIIAAVLGIMGGTVTASVVFG